jgi:HK97 family phage prohead protease
MSGQLQRRPTPGMQLRRDHLDLQIREINEEKRTATLSFSSEYQVTRWGWTEILCHDTGAANLARIQQIGVCLYNHSTDIRSVIGKVLRVWIDEKDRRGYAEVQFDEDDDSEKVWQKVRSGTLKGVSFGYRVTVWEEVAKGAVSTNGRFTGPCDVAMRWEPYEISICPVPADPSVGVNRSAEQDANNDPLRAMRQRDLYLLTLERS